MSLALARRWNACAIRLGTKLKMIFIRKGLEGTRINGLTQAGKFSKQFFKASRNSAPCHLEHTGSRIAHAIPMPAWHRHHHPRQHRHRLLIHRRASLPLMNKEDLIVITIPMDGEMAAWRNGVRSDHE